MPEDSMETAAIVSQIYSSLELYRQTGITISIMCDATNVFVGLLSNAQYFAVWVNLSHSAVLSIFPYRIQSNGQ